MDFWRIVYTMIVSGLMAMDFSSIVCSMMAYCVQMIGHSGTTAFQKSPNDSCLTVIDLSKLVPANSENFSASTAIDYFYYLSVVANCLWL